MITALQSLIDRIIAELSRSSKITHEDLRGILEKHLKTVVLDSIKIKMWKNKEYVKKLRQDALLYQCSCKKDIYPHYKYCPNCGRKIKRME